MSNNNLSQKRKTFTKDFKLLEISVITLLTLEKNNTKQ